MNFNKLFHNIYKENYNYGYAINDYANYCIENNKLFMPIGHNAKLYIANLQADTIETILDIFSKYTKTGFDINDYKFSKDRYADLKLKEFIQTISISGGFWSVVWDKYRKVYYFFIRYLNPGFTGKEPPYDAKTFSIQIFDESFNKKGETKLSTKDYWYKDVRVCPKGLLIENMKRNEDKKIKNYTLFGLVE
jgi:glycosyltransferase involved in cell wall biosynthesis